jgi:carboxymethylenebutenolidase
MNQHRLPSDIIGLSKVVPPLSRRGFMSSSAAAAAGYTLATGPVRADAIHTDSSGLDAGDAVVKVSGGDHAGLLRAACRRAASADHSRFDGDFWSARIH